MNSKKIAVISYHTCPLSDEKDASIGGLNTYVLGLSMQLSQMGYKVDIFTRSTDKNSPKVVKVLPNLRVIHLKAGRQTNLLGRQLINCLEKFVIEFRNFIGGQNLSYDLISCHYYLSGIIGLELKKTFNIPLIITFHTLALMKNLVARDDSERADVKRVEAEIMLVKTADKVIATSETDAEYIDTLYSCPKEKIFVLTPGLDHSLFKPMDKNKSKEYIGADSDHKLILSVGRIQPLKGIDVLLYAVKILVERNPDLKICLWIVGRERMINGRLKELKRLQKIRDLLNISSYVKFVKKQKHTTLPYFYNAAELVIMPSQYESFGITALEAMACKVPVITTDVTGISDLYDKKHKSLITSAGNPILLAEKIEALLTKESEYKKLGQEVFENVKDLSWKNAALKFKTICFPS